MLPEPGAGVGTGTGAIAAVASWTIETAVPATVRLVLRGVVAVLMAMLAVTDADPVPPPLFGDAQGTVLLTAHEQFEPVVTCIETLAPAAGAEIAVGEAE